MTFHPRIIGLSGRKGAGKSTLARHLADHGFTRMAFADPIKAMIAALYRDAGMSDIAIEKKLHGFMKEWPCEKLGGKSPRVAMQTLGTDWARGMIHDDIWIDIAREKATRMLLDGNMVVIDDVRTINEMVMIRAMGGVTIDVRRAVANDNVPADGHVTEAGVPADFATPDFENADQVKWYAAMIVRNGVTVDIGPHVAP